MRTLYAVLIVAVVAGCASIAPVKVQSGDTCYRCHRTIQDTKLAAEIIDQGDRIMTSYPFRTSGCMAKYLKVNPAGKSSTMFVTDYKTGHMLDAGSAWFVPLTLTGADGKKVEHDFAAFGSQEDANAFRADVPVRRWAQVLAEAVPD
jgi:hypothetical protein